jgi:hypothetical protein
MIATIKFFWVIPAWATVTGIYFMAAYLFLWRKAGVNMWKVWWQSDLSNGITERRFAKEISRFRLWNFAYQIVKWVTIGVFVGYIAYLFVYAQP